MDGFAGVTATDCNAAEVSVVVPETPEKVAVITVEPAATAVTNPLTVPAVPTVAMVVSVELHVAKVVRSWLAPLVKVPVALSCWVVPMAMEGFAGVNAIDANPAEVRVVDTETFPAETEMVVVPVAMAVTSPPGVTVATLPFVELQVAEAVRSCTEPSEKVPVALNWRDVPGVMLGLVGAIVREMREGGDELLPPHPASEMARSRVIR
jgi:hypothetical protein